ncbi:hypothetical protein [uncultured Gimesia sp.]|uniref:hypothetical protein n=1 Tax=uncultured Gimesia sp. TaxID=1678688 RepID=UPI0030D8FE91|tara:strand:+ start:75563 stop:77599 length:2037 start_codon:yes stop_codon:yes gene_type:complete
MPRLIYISIFILLIALQDQAVAQEASVKDYTIKLRAGWNAISFIDPPTEAVEFPNTVDWLVVPRDGKLLIHDLKGGQAALDTSSLLPEVVKSSFNGIADLNVGSLKPYEGCMVFCNKDTEIGHSVSDLKLLKMPKIPVGSWTFVGVPIGRYGDTPSDSDSGFYPPNEAPFFSFFAITKGKEPEVSYLSTTRPDSENLNDLSESWKQVRLNSESKGNWREEWRLRQGEAIWIKAKEKHLTKPDLRVTAIEEVKIELQQHQKKETPPWHADLSKSVILSFGSSLNYVDLKTSVAQGSSPCVLHLHEVDWYKVDNDWYEFNENGRPTKKKLLSILKAASKDIGTTPGEGFVRIEKPKDEPRISISHKYAVVPYLESSHGPWSYNRSIRINTERMTKGSVVDGTLRNRILEPGIYLGRIRLVSSAKNQTTLPNTIIFLEVPELYGGYEGSIAAQVLSIRGVNRKDPRTFFAEMTNRELGASIPFADLQNAARPGARSIQIGTFPVRVRFLPNGNAVSAKFLRNGSFLINEDMPLNVSYNFIALHSDFHAVNVSLDKAKKTLFLTQKLFRKVKPSLVPILGTPQPAPTSDNSNEKDVEVQREIQVLLQEEASGYLRGIFIERLGRSKSQPSKGSFVRRMEKNVATGRVTNFEQDIFVIGEINLFRTTTMNQEKKVVDQENGTE